LKLFFEMFWLTSRASVSHIMEVYGDLLKEHAQRSTN